MESDVVLVVGLNPISVFPQFGIWTRQEFVENLGYESRFFWLAMVSQIVSVGGY